jgi:ABC-2 type transport system permease protein
VTRDTAFRQAAVLARAELRAIRNRWTRADGAARRLRNLLIAIGSALWLFILAGSWRAFRHLLFGLTLTPELGGPLSLRLIEMAHLLFFVMLVISALSVTLSVFYLDPEIHYLRTTPLRFGVLVTMRLFIATLRSSWFVLFTATPMLLGYAFASAGLPSAPPIPEIFANAERLGALAAALARFPFYLALLAVYVIPPTLIGTVMAVLVARIVPARQAKSALVVLSLAGLCLVILGMRWMTPERFLRPKIDPNLGITLAAIAQPASPLLPSGWIAEAICNGSGEAVAKLLLLTAFTSVGAFLLVKRHQPAGANKIMTERAAEVSPRAVGYLKSALSPWPSTVRLVAWKDLLVFWRDPAQWSQLIVLLALVILYVFNFRQFSTEIGSRWLRDVISFVNLGMAGFVLVAVANRFVYSAVSLEGRAIWLLRSSPYPVTELLKAKAWVSFLPLLLLAEAITYFANRALGVSNTFQTAAVLVVGLMTWALTALGVGLGALAPRFDLRDPAQIGMSPTGIVFMGIGLLYVAITVVALASLMVLELQARFFLFTPGPMSRVIPLVVCVAANAAAIIVPWRIGVRHIARLEIK